MERLRCPRCVVLITAALCLSLAIAGCGRSGSSTGASGASGASGGQVSASAYAAATCAAVADYQSVARKRAQSLQQVLIGETDPGVAKARLSKFISDSASAVKQMAAKVKSAGVPDVPNGDLIAGGMNTAFSVFSEGLQSAEKNVKALPTSSQQAFSAAYQSVAAKLHRKFAEVRQIGSVFSGSDELHQAAEQIPACKPFLQGG
jgi:hypothetical protein